jgi:hypothetical protein
VETDICSKNAISWFRGNRPWWLLAAHLFIASLGIQVKNKYNPLSFKQRLLFLKSSKGGDEVGSVAGKSRHRFKKNNNTRVQVPPVAIGCPPQ